jgi:V/A-type H+-transporting ATPase subunit D
LRRNRDAARRGHDLLERKREALVRELAQRSRRYADAVGEAVSALAAARAALHRADVELGRATVDASSLAQPPTAAVEWRQRRLLGASVPEIVDVSPPFRPRYGAATTSESLDDAGESFAALVPILARLASSSAAVETLQNALARTSRRVNALERVILPRLDEELHRLAGVVEEDERDEGLRRRCLTRSRASARAGA